MTPAKISALRLSPEPDLDRGGRDGGDSDAETSDQRRKRRDDGESGYEGDEDERDAGHDGFGLGTQHLAARHGRGGDQVGRILAANGEPGEGASELSGNC